MSETETPKRKPQITIQYRDKDGLRVHVAADMGFRDPHWAKLKSKSIIDALCDILPLSWVRFIINYDRETAFTKQLERIFKEKKLPDDYIVIRVQSEDRQNIDSWFFIHHLNLADITDKAPQYSDIKPVEIHNKRSLEQILNFLFRSDLHPARENIRRWNASRYTEQQFRISRMEQLIRMARKREKTSIIDKIPLGIDFVSLLARLIKNDRPLMYNLKIVKVFKILVGLEKTKQIITRDEVIAVIEKLLGKKDWEKEGFYKGLPKHGADRDYKEGRAIIYKGKHLALTVLGEPSKGNAWDISEPPEVEPGEEHLE